MMFENSENVVKKLFEEVTKELINRKLEPKESNYIVLIEEWKKSENNIISLDYVKVSNSKYVFCYKDLNKPFSYSQVIVFDKVFCKFSILGIKYIIGTFTDEITNIKRRSVDELYIHYKNSIVKLRISGECIVVL